MRVKKALIFPLNGDTTNLIQNIEMCKEYAIVAVSSYKEDKKELEKMDRETKLYCSTDFESCLQMVEVVIFAENTMGHAYSGYKWYVEKAVKSGNNIIISASLVDLLGIDYKRENMHILQKKELIEKVDYSKLKDIPIPILSVMGLGENCDKFKLQIKIKKLIEKKGYKILCVCSNALGIFLGMEILPGFLFSKTISLPIKIQAFNLWLYNLQKQSSADIILVGCPSGIMRFEDYEYNYYSEIPLTIHSAVEVDNSIMTLYKNSLQSEETIERLKKFCQMKYDTIVEDFVIAEQYYTSDHELKKLSYFSNKEYGDFEKPYMLEGKGSILAIEEELNLENQVNRILAELENNFYAI